MILRTPISTLFPYTTLFRSWAGIVLLRIAPALRTLLERHFSAASVIPTDRRSRTADQADCTSLWRVTAAVGVAAPEGRSEEHTSELQSLRHLVCRLLLEKKK